MLAQQAVLISLIYVSSQVIEQESASRRYDKKAARYCSGANRVLESTEGSLKKFRLGGHFTKKQSNRLLTEGGDGYKKRDAHDGEGSTGAKQILHGI